VSASRSPDGAAAPCAPVASALWPGVEMASRAAMQNTVTHPEDPTWARKSEARCLVPSAALWGVAALSR
jgi:hypothetical protein